MKMPRYLLLALNVHKEEWWLVQKLFWLQFFQGAGIAFFFTSAFSRFLEHFPVTDLAYVYILSSFLLWITGFVYNKLEHRLSASRLCFIITLILGVSMLLFRAGVEIIPDNWFYFLMLAWFNVLYLLNNLMFWGMASQLYNVRQSKRLFGVISAGDIPAKFIGYTVALLIVSYTGTVNLLLAGAFFILLSFPFLKKILTAGTHEENNDAHTTKHSAALHTIVKDYTVNKLIRRVAILSLIVSGCIILINYGFYAEVKHAYKDDVALARFIALFLAIARLFAMLIKILFTSRLLYWLGNRLSLIIAPVLLILLIAALLYIRELSFGTKYVLYIFGLSAILIDVLNSAINSPVLLTIMQPLSTIERLRAHNIVKGIMDPFAYLISGLFILVIEKLQLLSLEVLSYALLALALAWIIGIFRVHQQYLKTLIKTISSRYFSQEEFSLYDTAARELIENKINTGTELEVMYILRMLSSRRSAESNKLIIHALNHPSVKVAGEALRIIGELHIKEAEPLLTSIIDKHRDFSIRSESIKVLAKIAFQDSILVPLMDSDDKTIRRSSIVSVLNYSLVDKNKLDAEHKIKQLLSSENPDDKIEATTLLCDTSRGHFDEELIQLLNEKEPRLQQAAIKAIGHHPSTRCLENLMKIINENEKYVLEALITAREKSLPFIKERVLSENCHTKQKETLLNAIGRISGKASHEILLSLLIELQGYEPHIIKVLHRCHFKATKGNQKLIEDLIRNQLIYAAALLHMQKNLIPQKDKYHLMFGSLQLELNEIRETLLFLFSFIYDRDKISKVKAAIEINRKETNANAIELVDMTIKKEFANPFNAVFEFGDLEHRCALLRNLFPKDIYPDIDTIISEVLTDNKMAYNYWTKSCSLYVSKKYQHRLEKKIITKYLESESILLKVTAEYTIQNY